jgi:hypothetical protein
MCTTREKHEFTACTQFEATCLKEATDMYAENDNWDFEGEDVYFEANFDVYAGWFTLLKKCPEADLHGFGACARDGDHEGYGDDDMDDTDWEFDDDRTCPEFCAAVEAGEAYEDDADDSSYSESACAAFDAAVARAKATCEADGTCAAIEAALYAMHMEGSESEETNDDCTQSMFATEAEAVNCATDRKAHQMGDQWMSGAMHMEGSNATEPPAIFCSKGHSCGPGSSAFAVASSAVAIFVASLITILV